MAKVDRISVVLLLAVGLLMARPAYAYVDPGTGGMLVQLVTGGVAGLLVLARLYWSKISSALGLGKKPTGPADPPAAQG